MCPPVEMTDDELSRAAARVRVAGMLKPGSRVEVIKREVSHPPDKRGNIGGYTLEKLALWLSPSSTGPALARQWRQRRKESTFKEELERHKGPVLFKGERATVMALLPEVQCELTGSRPWALLLSDDGRLGWCYALDGLRQLEF